MSIIDDLQYVSNKKKAIFLQRFFKTGKGEYAEGDKFLGITVPIQRQIAKKYRDLPLPEIESLLQRSIHEFRLTALLILTYQFSKADETKKKLIYNFYLSHTTYINNWDLVDLSSHEIIGGWLATHPRDRKILIKLAKSDNLWEKRIAMISTFEFLRYNQWNDTLAIAQILLYDKHDLIHKAVGWGLREVGKRNLKAEEEFLLKYYKTMPRTMLRYAIEKFPENKRKYYMK
jgi:3-methyladenine DNA glycosylase AlkD